MAMDNERLFQLKNELAMMRERKSKRGGLQSILGSVSDLGQAIGGDPNKFKPTAPDFDSGSGQDDGIKRQEDLIAKYSKFNDDGAELKLYEDKKKIDNKYSKPAKPKDLSKDQLGVFNKWSSNATTKNTRVMGAAYNKIKKLYGAGGKEMRGSDTIAMVFSYMKVLDPTSTVREGEFATAANAGGLGEKVRNFLNSLLEGEIISAKVATDMVGTVKKVLQGQQTSQKEYDKRMYDLAKRFWGEEGAKKIFGEFKYGEDKSGEGEKPIVKGSESHKTPAKGIHIKGNPVTTEDGKPVLSDKEVRDAPDGTVFFIGKLRRFKVTIDGKVRFVKKQPVKKADIKTDNASLNPDV